MGYGVGSNVSGVVRLASRAHVWALHAFHLFLLYFLPVKTEKWKFLVRMRGKVDSGEVESKWLKGDSLA